MNASTIIELVGYTGSILVVVSMLMTSLTKLRVINTLGSVIFATYALIIKSYPTAAMQVALIIINMVNIYNLSKNRKQYVISELKNGDSYIKFFVDSHRKDIEKFFPKIDSYSESSVTDEQAKIYLVAVGSTTAGLMLARKTSDDSLQIDLDYTTPAYRDCSVGKFLFQYLGEHGVKKAIIENNNANHAEYLKKMGFAKQGDVFVKEF